MNDDGHTTECTYSKCAHPESPAPCPFVMSAKSSDYFETIKADMNAALMERCKHEWRQLNEAERFWNDRVPRFFCIHCKKIEQ